MSGPQTISAMDLLHLREAEWGNKLSAVSLCAEAAVPTADLEQTLHVVGRMYRLARSDFQKGVRLKAFPAVHVLSTTTVAAEHYESGTFWPKLSELIDVEMTPGDQAVWGQAFLENLKKLRMPTFSDSSDAGTRYVGRILLHCGIPSSSLHDFFRLVSSRRRMVPGLAAEEFVDWAQSGALNIDAPVKRFLRYGGEFAVDVTERTFDLLDLVQSGGDPAAASLPERFVQAAQVLAQSEDVGRGPGASPQQGGIDRPAIVLQPYGQGVILRLPPVSEVPDGTAVWLVGIDGKRQRIATKPGWPGSSEPAPSVDVTIGAPVRAVTAALETRGDLVVTVPVVNDDFPLLGFGEDGRRLSPGGVWRESSAWLLFPGDETALDVEGGLVVRHQGQLPPGWAGWALLHVDLTGAHSLGLKGLVSRQRLRRQISAELHFADPVDGVTTEVGDAVWSVPPDIELPDDGSDGEWEVAVLDNTGAALTSYTYVGAGFATDIWDEVERPLIGTYTVRVRGAWGRGLSRSFTLIEGLSVETVPGWRRFDGSGLTLAESKVSAAEGVAISACFLEFGASDVNHRLRAWHGMRTCSVLVEPAHMSVLFQTGETTLGPRTRAIDLSTEDLVESGGELVVLTGSVASPTLYYVSGSTAVQSLTPRQQQGGTAHRVDLSALSDTLAHHPAGRLCLDPEGMLAVATIRPRRLVGGVAWDGDDIVLSDAVDQPGLAVILYATTAPWLAPVSLPVSAGRVTVPQELRCAGKLQVLVRLDDPWFPEPLPVWPGPGQAKLLDAPGYVSTAGSPLLALHLAGAGEFSLSDVDLEHLWIVAGRRFGLGLGADLGAKLAPVREALAVDPARALRALAQSSLDTAEQIEVLVWSGLAALPVRDIGDRGLRFDERAIVPSVLRLTQRDRLSDLAAEWVAGCGIEAEVLLAGDPDPFIRVGRLDKQSDMYHFMEPHERDGLKAHLGWVPHALLHPDSRALAALRLVDHALEEHLVPFYKRTESIVRICLQLMDKSGLGLLRPAIEARLHPEKPKGWRAGTAASLALALTARMAAREVEGAASVLRSYSRVWNDLALNLPELVRIDLVLAENLLRGVLHPEEVRMVDELEDED